MSPNPKLGFSIVGSQICKSIEYISVERWDPETGLVFPKRVLSSRVIIILNLVSSFFFQNLLICFRNNREEISLSNGHANNGDIPAKTSDLHMPNGTATKETLQKANRTLSNGNITNGNLPKHILTNGTCTKSENSKNIEIYNYSCDLMKKPFTWNEFMKMNEKQEPLMPSLMSVSGMPVFYLCVVSMPTRL